MPSITLLEQVLRRPDGLKHAQNITRILRQRRARLILQNEQPLPRKTWQSNQQLIAACDSAVECIAILYRRYHNQSIEKENSYDPF